MHTNRLLILSVFELFIFSQCIDVPKKNSKETRKFENSVEIKLDSNKLYFPLKTDNNSSSLDISTNRWYSDMLYALNEPVLFENRENEKKTIYRFTWLRTRYNPVSIRIEKEKYTIYCKVTNGQGGYSPGRLSINVKGEITEQEWNNFQKLLTQTAFWNMPTTIDDSGKDGSEWILEGVENNKYHVVARWTPKGSAFKSCCEYLLERTNLKISDNEKY